MMSIQYEKLNRYSLDSQSPSYSSPYDLEANKTDTDTNIILTDINNDDDDDDDYNSTTPKSQAKSAQHQQPPINPRIISDALLGLSDGMTVPFALTASLSSLGDTRVVVLAGLAELVAGAISMGLGGYLGAKSEREIYDGTLERTRRECEYCLSNTTSTSSSSTSSTSSLSLTSRQQSQQQSHTPNKITGRAYLESRITSTFQPYNLPSPLINNLTTHLLTLRLSNLTSFLLTFDLNLPTPPDSRALTCALTIGTGYFIGGLIPLLPYILVSDRKNVGGALWASIITMVVTLFLVGFGKGWIIAASTSTSGSLSFSDDNDCDGCDEYGSGVHRSGEFGWAGKGRVFGDVRKCVWGGVQMVLVGGISAGCAVGLVRLCNSFI